MTNENDLISRSELLKRIDEEREYLKSRGQFGAEHILVHNFRELVENAPTVEARSQGEWKIIADVYCKCPFCSNVEVKFSDYCPECGARLEVGEDMRGDNDDG